MGVDWIRRMLGQDIPFRTGDQLLYGEDQPYVLRLERELDDAHALAHKRAALLQDVVRPYSSHLEEQRVRNAIRRHLRETHRA